MTNVEPMTMSQFQEYIKERKPLKRLHVYCNERSSEPQNILNNILQFVRPAYQEEVRGRFEKVEFMLDLITRCLYGKCSGYFFLQEELKDFLNHQVPTRLFLSGGFAGYLIGRFSYFTDIDLFVAVDDPACTVTDNEYFGYFSTHTISQEIFGIKVDVVAVSNTTLNSLHHDCHDIYGDDHLPFFYTFDFFEVSNFIEITPTTPIKLFIEECECNYLSEEKNLYQNYKMRSEIVNDYVTTKQIRLKLRSVELSKARLEKYRERTQITDYELKNPFFNFLKPSCNKCVRREQISTYNFKKCNSFRYQPYSKLIHRLHRSYYN